MSPNVIITPYDGFINQTHLVLSGRVLRNAPVIYQANDGFFRNLQNSWKSFISNELTNITVTLTFLKKEYECTTDEEGYYYFEIEEPQDLESIDYGWSSYKVFLHSSSLEKLKVRHEVVGIGRVLRPDPSANFGVISDIDDTLLKTDIRTLWRWRMFYNSVFLNPYQRKIVEYSQQLLDKLTKSGNREQPIFYISNSPNNLYGYVRALLDFNRFVKGPIFLRDIGRQLFRPRRLTEGNKYIQCVKLLQSYPELKFILIGDAAESDIDIYLEINRKFKDRILLIGIRSLNERKKDKYIRKQGVDGTPIVLFNTFYELEKACIERGLL